MRISTWVLLVLLALLTSHYPSFVAVVVEVAFGGVTVALEQPALLAVAAVGIVVHRIRMRWA